MSWYLSHSSFSFPWVWVLLASLRLEMIKWFQLLSLLFEITRCSPAFLHDAKQKPMNLTCSTLYIWMTVVKQNRAVGSKGKWYHCFPLCIVPEWWRRLKWEHMGIILFEDAVINLRPFIWKCPVLDYQLWECFFLLIDLVLPTNN